jgi:hypothetical protein
MRGGVGHAATAARRAEAAALAREGDDAIEAAAVAVHAHEAMREDPAAQEGAKLPRDEAGHRSLARGRGSQEALELLLHDLVEIARFGLAARVAPSARDVRIAKDTGGRERCGAHTCAELPASCRAKEELSALHLLAGTGDAVARARFVRHPEFTRRRPARIVPPAPGFRTPADAGTRLQSSADSRYRPSGGGAFFDPEILRFLDGESLGYAIQVPLWKWLGLREKIASRTHWTRVDGTVSGFARTLAIPQWGRSQRVVIHRKRVFHETARNSQFDLFSPDDGHFEYSAVATNPEFGVAALWHFMAGRGGPEKTLGELEQLLGFAAIPSRDRQANELWQQLSILTYDLARSFQLCVAAAARPRTHERTFLYRFLSLPTLRFTLLDQPARLRLPSIASIECRIGVAPPEANERRIHSRSGCACTSVAPAVARARWMSHSCARTPVTVATR